MKVMFWSIFLFRNCMCYPGSVNYRNNQLKKYQTLTRTYASINIKPGYYPYYPSKEGIPYLIPNATNSIIDTKQINVGYSKYGYLSNKSQFECSGGLNECINSCCVNGKCIQSEYQCAKIKDIVQLTYVVTFALSTILFSIFFVSYIFIDWSLPEEIKQKIVEKVKRDTWHLGKTLQPHYPCINEIITERIDESSNIGQTVLNTNQSTSRHKEDEEMTNNLKCLSKIIENDSQNNRKAFVKQKTMDAKYHYKQPIIIDGDQCITEENRKSTGI